MLDYFLKQNIRSCLKRHHRNHCFLNYNDIRKVLILFDIEDWYEIVPIIEALKKEGKSVTAWTIKPKQAQAFRFPPYVRVIEPSRDMNWMNLFRPELLREFSNQEYDTLLDLSSGENDHLLLLLAQNKSSFSIGLIEREYKLYDFILLKDKEQTLLDMYNQLKNYLEHIQ